MTMFDTFDRTGAAEFPFSRDLVYRALSKAIPTISGMTIEHEDALTCRLSVSAGMSAFSWGEKITVAVIENGSDRALVQIGSGPKTILGSATTHSKNRKNVDRILRAASDILQQSGAAWQAEKRAAASIDASDALAPSTIESRLRRLAQLRTDGLISEIDFESRKAEILREV